MPYLCTKEQPYTMSAHLLATMLAPPEQRREMLGVIHEWVDYTCVNCGETIPLNRRGEFRVDN